jgi:hypothetical protein
MFSLQHLVLLTAFCPLYSICLLLSTLPSSQRLVFLTALNSLKTYCLPTTCCSPGTILIAATWSLYNTQSSSQHFVILTALCPSYIICTSILLFQLALSSPPPPPTTHPPIPSLPLDTKIYHSGCIKSAAGSQAVAGLRYINFAPGLTPGY